MDFLDILKWIGIVLAAGFVGYFGRYLAKMIIERVHRRKERETIAIESPPAQDAAQLEVAKQKAKLAKKKAKARAKRLKKKK